MCATRAPPVRSGVVSKLTLSSGRALSPVSLIDRPSLDDSQPFPVRRSLPSETAKENSLAGSGHRAPMCSVSRSSRRAGSTLHCRFQDSPNWATPSGVAKKRRQIERQGIPELKGRRFLTLTLDPEFFGFCPITGYLAGKEHMRRFLEAGRLAGLWDRDAWWCWKLEFQKNTWAHWHLIIDRTKKFTVEEMSKIHKIWGLGRTNCRRISQSKFGYQFKYAFKGVFQDDSEDSGLCLPLWFLDFHTVSSNGSKPSTFARVRFWQTSKGFYTDSRKTLSKASAPVSSFRPRTVREILDERTSSVLVIARDRLGRYQRSTRLRLAVDFAGFSRFHSWDSDNGAATTLSFRSYMCNPETVKNKLIEKHEKWKLQQLIQENKISLHLAKKFRAQQLSLETC
jgi:hypothetical protein